MLIYIKNLNKINISSLLNFSFKNMIFANFKKC